MMRATLPTVALIGRWHLQFQYRTIHVRVTDRQCRTPTIPAGEQSAGLRPALRGMHIGDWRSPPYPAAR